MPNQAIASLHNYSSRFLRSTDLLRDFDDPQGLRGYWLTDFGRSCLNRISDGFRPDSGRRAWIQGMPLGELRKPENADKIRARYLERKQRIRKSRGDKKLVETLAGLEDEDDSPKACLICQL